MKRFLLFCFISSTIAAGDDFRLQLLQEPANLDPQATAISGGNYLFNSVYRGLFRYHSERGLIPEGAKACTRKRRQLICTLNPKHHWSDGKPIRAEDYVTTFRRLLTPERKSPQSELLFALQNAHEIWAGKLPPERLGVHALNATTLRFDFAVEDLEFEYKLISPALAPWPPTGFLPAGESAKMPFSGPYAIEEWRPGHFIRLKPNPYYGLPANDNRPNIQAVFVDADSTALRLYESGKLDFLRRLSAEDSVRYKGHGDFHQIPMARFDYVGFGPTLEDYPELRQALIYAVDFKSFMSLFDTETPPGCPSLPSRFLDHEICLKPDFTAAQKLKEKKVPPRKIEFAFSRLGGDDIARAAEWFQGQWKTHLDLNVELNSIEQTVFLGQLKVHPPAVFRKGVSLDRPTCLAALELFTEGSPENYIHLQSTAFERRLTRLKSSSTPATRRRLCREAIELLLRENRMIPLGEMYFTILVRTQFRNWNLNELNQLDLTDLTAVQ